MRNRRRQKFYDLQRFRGDLSGGFTSAVVTLPVALALGVVSGLGAAAGLYGAIAVGFFAALFGGTRAQLSAPTAPTTVALAVILASLSANLTEALTVIVLAGLLQVLMGVSGIGRFVAYTPYVVVSGFMSGVGIIMIVIQVLPFLGAPSVPGGPLDAIHALPEAVANINISAFSAGVLTLALASLWPRRMARLLPAPLVALLAGTLAGVLWLSEAPVVGNVPARLPELHLELPSAGFLVRALQPAIILALLGAVHSLLTSLVADSLTGGRHNPNRELVGQGIGNVASGLIGGLPGAGTTIGTAINIRAGGRTRASGAFSGIVLLMFLLGLGQFVEAIPRAVLAGLLIKVGWDIIDWHLLARLHRIRREHLVVMMITLGLTVFVDLVTGIAIGLIAAAMAHSRQLERLEMDSVVSTPLLDQEFFSNRQDDPGADAYLARVGLLALRGSFTVASSNRLARAISADIKDHEVVIFDFSRATHLDDSAAMVIKKLMDIAREERTEFVVMGLSGPVAETLQALAVLRQVPESQIVATLDEARQAAKDLLGG